VAAAQQGIVDRLVDPAVVGSCVQEELSSGFIVERGHPGVS